MPQTMNRVTADERAQKYDAEARRWKERPEISACWRGDFREWRIDGRPRDESGNLLPELDRGVTGTCYQNQLYCRHWKSFINPDGFTCSLCADRSWPMIEHYRAHVSPELIRRRGDEAAQNALVQAVKDRWLTKQEALQLADEFWSEK